MILLDTAVLAYAVGEQHPRREPCRRIFAAQELGQLEARTTIEVIQEFAHVRARRRTRFDATAIARAYTNTLTPFATEMDDLLLGIDLFDRIPPLGAFDAVLAATALNRQAEALISADRAFGSVAGMRRVDPATSALTALLER